MLFTVFKNRSIYLFSLYMAVCCTEIHNTKHCQTVFKQPVFRYALLYPKKTAVTLVAAALCEISSVLQFSRSVMSPVVWSLWRPKLPEGHAHNHNSGSTPETAASSFTSVRPMSRPLTPGIPHLRRLATKHTPAITSSTCHHAPT